MEIKRTPAECQAEAKKLAELKPRVRRSDIWGGDNHKQIEAQIKVLDGSVPPDGIYDAGWNRDAEGAAQDAVNWMTGDEDESPSESWAAIAR